MTNCDYETKVQAYHDGELSPGEAENVRKHISGCESCAKELEELQKMSQLFASARMPEISAAGMRRLYAGSNPVVERTLLRTSEAFAMAAALVLVICSAWLWEAAKAESASDTPQPWETAANTLRVESTASNDAETHVAQWIVTDLAGGNASD